MKKDTHHVIERRSEHYQIRLVGEGLLVGAVSGIVVLAYRIALTKAGDWLNAILDFVAGNPLRIAGWFAVLALFAVVVARLVKWEPMISGSGIPQIEGELAGKLDQVWWRVLPAKFAGGFLSLLAGLSLGREGPSIQLGAMTGKGLSKALDCDMTEEEILITCGASAGLSAAFHAPLAGIMFSLEEVHKNFAMSVLVSTMCSSLTADFISSHLIGLEPVFQFEVGPPIEHADYWIILLLGALLGVLGAFYNYVTLKAQSLYKALPVGGTVRMMIPFLTAGVLGLVLPAVLGSGHALVEQAAGGELLLGSILLILVVKFLFSAVSFGSGAPGGIFFPLLVLGSLAGAAYGTAGILFFHWNAAYINNLVLLSMAGFFTAIVRAPLTGIILIFEMTGTVSHLMSLALVSITAYVVANLLRSAPIYESLLERLLAGQDDSAPHVPEPDARMLLEFNVMHGSVLVGHLVADIGWPKECLIVAIQRGTAEILPKGDTRIEAGDMLVVMTSAGNHAYISDLMGKLCCEGSGP